MVVSTHLPPPEKQQTGDTGHSGIAETSKEMISNSFFGTRLKGGYLRLIYENSASFLEICSSLSKLPPLLPRKILWGFYFLVI